MSSAKSNSCCSFGSGSDTIKVFVWLFFSFFFWCGSFCLGFLYIIYIYKKMLITCLNLSFLSYPIVSGKLHNSD